MISDATRHSGGHLLPLLGRTAALGRKRRDDFLSQASVCPAEMTIAATEVKLTLHAIVLLGEADGLTGKTPVLVPHSAVVTFYESGVEVLADG